MFNPFRKSNHRRHESAMGVAVLGCLMMLTAVPTLFVNEGRAVKTARALAEGAAAVVSVDCEQSDQVNEGKLVHLSGIATTEETLVDNQFGVTANAIRLIRTTETFQWKEVEEKVTRKLDGKSKTTTEYSYQKVWDSKHLSSDSFHAPEGHENPASLRFEPKEFEAENVTVGQFVLPSDLVAQMTNSEPIDVNLSEVPSEVAVNLRADQGSGTSASGFYWAVDPESTEPKIGDARVRFSVVKPATVSVIAQQSQDSLQPFRTSNGREISMIRSGNAVADKMFDDAQSQNSAVTWALRFAGVIRLIVCIGLALRPLTSIVQRIPLLGSLIGLGAALIAMLLGGSMAISTISVAWLFYRPLIAIPMIVVAIGMLVVLVKMSKQRSNKPEFASNMQNV